MEGYEPFASLALAGAAGLLIGLERERSAPRENRDESFLGGARTHPLFALVGGLAALLAGRLGASALLVPFAALALFLLANYAGDVLRGGHRGLTSEAAFLLSFLLGAVACTSGLVEPLTRRIFVVSAVAVVSTFLLSSKRTLHPLVQRISPEDLGAALKFLIVAVVVVPLLPDETVGPLEVLNPRQVGILAVVISAISFVGYAGTRLFGPERGLGLTGIVGGLVSSTAVTLSMSGRARERPEIADSAAVAVGLASTIMFARVLVLVAFVNPPLVREVAFPMVGGAAGGIAAAFALWRRSRRRTEQAGALAVGNPFELGAAVRFALAFAVVLVGSKAAATYLGTAATYAAGALAGTTDVDPITLSMAKLAGKTVTEHVAATTIFLAAMSNTVVKAVLSITLGGPGFGRRVAAAHAVMLVAGGLGLALAWAR